MMGCAAVAGAEDAPVTNAPVAVESPAPPAKEPTTITSDRLQVDYAHNMGTFEGNVLAVDPQITVRADKVIVWFGEGATTNAPSLRKIVAEGGVVITQGDRKATSERAEYTGDDGRVVLTGNPQVQSADGTVTGEKITFWRGENKMDVESGTRLVIDPSKLKREESPARSSE
jgi:lipopolysaccharide export system protein LptA